MGAEVWKLLKQILSEFEGPGRGPKVGGVWLIKRGGSINNALGLKTSMRMSLRVSVRTCLLQMIFYSHNPILN